MNRTLIITKDKLDTKSEFILQALYEDRRMVEANCEKEDAANILGNIYIARVKNVAENLNAAFVEIGGDQVCYLPLEGLVNPVFTKKVSKKRIAEGEELLVQVEKEAIKTKDAIVTTNLSLSGKYVVVTLENKRLGLSGKFSKSDKIRFRRLFSDFSLEDAGLIVRTNAADASDSDVITEAERLRQKLLDLIRTSVHKEAKCAVYRNDDFYLNNLKNYYMKDIEKILTDDGKIYAKLKEFIKSNQPEDLPKLSFYEDNAYSLNSLYNIAGNIENAMKPRVWLKSGANIIIESTEALTVIDVNSGKNVAKKNKQENFLKINKEAAEEIARQLRLRNISGMILVDFINMDSTEKEEELVCFLDACLRKDTIKTQFIDITKLGLVEITRKKTKKTLGEQMI